MNFNHLLLILILLLCGGNSVVAEDGPTSRTEFLFSTVITVTIRDYPDQSAEILLDECFQWMSNFEVDYTPDKDNRLGRINRGAAAGTVELDSETSAMMRAAREAWKRSNGLYDITVGPLSECYGFKTENPGLPADEIWQQARQRIGWENLQLDAQAQTLKFLKPGMSLDLGGLAKGFAIDHVFQRMLEAGVTSALIQGGGDIRVIGQHGERPFFIGVADPEHAVRTLCRLEVSSGEAVATSGDYERFFIQDGVRYCHIFDPRTGRPGNQNRAATVIADNGQLAEALSLSAFLMTAEAALEYVEKAGGAGLIIDQDNRIHQSPRMKLRSRMDTQAKAQQNSNLYLLAMVLLVGFIILSGRRGKGAEDSPVYSEPED